MANPLYTKEMKFEDVLDGIYTLLYSTGYALTEGDYQGRKIFVMSKVRGDGVLEPVCQLAQIVPDKGVDWRAADGFSLAAKPLVVS